MADEKTLEALYRLIQPVNRKDVPLSAAVSFAVDLELDSLTVMDLVADIEDEFDIIIPINMLPDLETIGQVADAVETIVEGAD